MVFVIRTLCSEEGYLLEHIINEGFTEDEGVDGVGNCDEELCSIKEGQ